MRSTILTLPLALLLVLAVASPAFANIDEDNSFLSQRLDLHKKLFKIPTGATGPLFHGLFGRKMLPVPGTEANVDLPMHQQKLDKLKKLLPTGIHATGPHHDKIHDKIHDVEFGVDSLFRNKLDKLKKLLPTGAWMIHADDEDAHDSFLPSHKLTDLKKLLPTGHWKWDSDALSLTPADEKSFFHSKIGKKALPTGTLPTGHWGKN